MEKNWRAKKMKISKIWLSAQIKMADEGEVDVLGDFEAKIE